MHSNTALSLSPFLYFIHSLVLSTLFYCSDGHTDTYIDHWLLVIDNSILVIDHWLLVIDYWLLRGRGGWAAEQGFQS